MTSTRLSLREALAMEKVDNHGTPLTLASVVANRKTLQRKSPFDNSLLRLGRKSSGEFVRRSAGDRHIPSEISILTSEIQIMKKKDRSNKKKKPSQQRRVRFGDADDNGMLLYICDADEDDVWYTEDEIDTMINDIKKGVRRSESNAGDDARLENHALLRVVDFFPSFGMSDESNSIRYSNRTDSFRNKAFNAVYDRQADHVEAGIIDESGLRAAYIAISKFSQDEAIERAKVDFNDAWLIWKAEECCQAHLPDIMPSHDISCRERKRSSEAPKRSSLRQSMRDVLQQRRNSTPNKLSRSFSVRKSNDAGAWRDTVKEALRLVDEELQDYEGDDCLDF